VHQFIYYRLTTPAFPLNTIIRRWHLTFSMNSTNPFRNQHTAVASPPPSYETSVGPYNHKYSDEKSDEKREKERSPDRFPHDGPSNWNPEAYREHGHHPLENPMSTQSRYNPTTYPPDRAVSGMSNFRSTSTGPQMLQQQSNQNRGLFGGIGGNNIQFSRMPPQISSYDIFSPMTLMGASHSLNDGWIVMPPHAPPGIQHPFLTHDVTEEDWTRFVLDMNRVARLDTLDSSVDNLTGVVHPVTGLIMSFVLQKRMRRNKVEPISYTIDAWNNQFFHPRRMSVVLAHGRKRYSGLTDDYPPDIGRHLELDERGDARGRRSSSPSDGSSSDSDSSSDSERHEHQHDGRGRHLEQHRRALDDSLLHSSRNNLQKGLSFLLEYRRSKSLLRDERKRGKRRAKWERKERSVERKERRADRREFRRGIIRRGITAGIRGASGHGSEEKWRLVVCFFDGRREVF